jgi:hypothetical protein
MHLWGIQRLILVCMLSFRCLAISFESLSMLLFVRNKTNMKCYISILDSISRSFPNWIVQEDMLMWRHPDSKAWFVTLVCRLCPT